MFGLVLLSLLGKLSLPILLMIGILYFLKTLQTITVWFFGKLKKLFPSYFNDQKISQQVKTSLILSFKLKLLKHFILGLATFYIVFSLFEIAPNLMENKEANLDSIMYYMSEFTSPQSTTKVPPFVLVDIDQQTIKDWNINFYTPRSKLVNLIEATVNTKPKIIIVDIDISSKTNNDIEDNILINYLHKYTKQCQNNECPPIIFVRGVDNVDKKQFYNLRTDFAELEKLVKKHPDLLHWASANFMALGASQINRGWKLWLPTCDSEKQLKVIPSVQLLTKELLQGGNEKNIQTGLKDFLPSCDNSEVILPKFFKYKDLSISTIDQDIRNRFIYRIPYENSDILQIFPAHNFLNHSNLDFNEKIVVIGSQFGDRVNTFYITPLDDNVPGSIIVINAIYSLLQYGTIEPIPILGWILIVLTLIVIVMFIYFITKKVDIKIKSKLKLLSIIAFLAIGFYGVTILLLYKFSIWLNIAFFSLILQTVFLFQDTEELYNSKE